MWARGSSMVARSISKIICLYYTETHTAMNRTTKNTGILLELNINGLQYTEKLCSFRNKIYDDQKTTTFKTYDFGF
jgi:hypothetical protein